jgi:hypothetical protein
MTEEITVPDTEVPVTPTAEVVKTEKTYTDADVQRLISERVNREKLSFKHQTEEFTQRETGYKETIESYEKIINKSIEAQLADFPEPVKKLLAKLSIVDKLEFLSDPTNKVEKPREFPKKPDDGKEESSPVRKLKTIF